MILNNCFSCKKRSTYVQNYYFSKHFYIFKKSLPFNELFKIAALYAVKFEALVIVTSAPFINNS